MANGITDVGGKLSKEQQATLKSVETIISAYSEKLKPIESETSVDGEAATSLPSHGAVLEIEKSSTAAKLIRKQIIDEMEEVDAIAKWVIDNLISIHGRIGWIDNSLGSGESAEGNILMHSNLVSVNSTLLDKNVTTVNNSNGTTEVSLTVDSKTEKRKHDSSSISKPSFVSINEELATLGSDDRRVLLNKCETLKTFLGISVLPHLAKGMIKIARESPDDPIKFLANFLKEMGDEEEVKEGHVARKEFYSKLADAEGRSIEEFPI